MKSMATMILLMVLKREPKWTLRRMLWTVR